MMGTKSSSPSSFEEDPLSKWCISEDLSKSIWVSNKDAYRLLMKDTTPSLNNTSLSEIIHNTDSFPLEFPIETVKCKKLQSQVSKDTLERNIRSVYPVIHEKVLQQCARLLIKKSGRDGSKMEQELYKNMDLESFIGRLLTKRAVMFVGPRDKYMLLDNTMGAGNWETIGTDQEQPPLILKDYLSYDEIKISAFLSVSSYTHFLNNGNRNNKGLYSENREDIQDEGIIIGLIGPRFQRKNLMDYQDIILEKGSDETGNTIVDFYEETYVKYKDIIKQPEDQLNRFLQYKPKYFFDKVIYSKRIAVSFDTLMIEANARAKAANKMAFVHVVGIGLGVWKISPNQDDLFIETCMKRLQMLQKHLHNVSDVCFAYFKVPESEKFKFRDISIEGHPAGGIKIHFINREPHQKLIGPHEGKLLVVSYAWDGNALPGNEFWAGNLWTSGDPAAACSTQVAELHNAHINSILCGKNLKIVTSSGILTLEEYRRKVENFMKNF